MYNSYQNNKNMSLNFICGTISYKSGSVYFFSINITYLSTNCPLLELSKPHKTAKDLKAHNLFGSHLIKTSNK